MIAKRLKLKKQLEKTENKTDKKVKYKLINGEKYLILDEDFADDFRCLVKKEETKKDAEKKEDINNEENIQEATFEIIEIKEVKKNEDDDKKPDEENNDDDLNADYDDDD